MASKILIADDEESIRFTFKTFLENEGYEVDAVETLAAGLQLLDDSYDLIFLDIYLGRDNGLSLLHEVQSRRLLCPVVMITGSPEIASAAESLRYGAFDYICKPVTQLILLQVAAKALEHKRLLCEKETFRMRLEGLFRCATEGIVMTDNDLRVVAVNKSARTLLGLDDSVVGCRLDQLPNMQYPIFSRFCDIIRSRFDGEIYRLQCHGADGSSQFVSMSASPLINDDGTDYGGVLIIRDENRRGNADEINGSLSGSLP